MAHRDDLGAARGNRPGELSLSLGLVALVFAVVPVIGDVVVPPTALAAVVLGVLGVRRTERRAATNYAASLSGTVLGVLAVLCYALTFAVTSG